MKLPAKGEKVPRKKVIEICNHYKLNELCDKIVKYPPEHDFVSDGCSWFFDKISSKSIYPACFFHDLWYWSGKKGEKQQRFEADIQLMLDVSNILNGRFIAVLMFLAVRIFGRRCFKFSFSWGYGRKQHLFFQDSLLIHHYESNFKKVHQTYKER